MRNAVAPVVGILVIVVTLHLIRGVGAALGVLAEIPLPYPVEHSYGRYASELIDSTDTLFGKASFACAVAVGVTAGYAIRRGAIRPWRSDRREGITARAWGTFLLFVLPYSAIVQLLFGKRTSPFPVSGFILDFIEYGVTFYVGWRTWKWWKAATSRSANNNGN
jgi:hypothetical protein